MSTEEETEEGALDEHNPAPPSERIWMPVYQDEDNKLAKHDWCLDTGIIKNLSGEEAKPKGFYVSVLNKMKYILEHDLGHNRGAPKFPNSQIKLILKDLDKIAYVRFASVYTNFKEVEDFNDYVEEFGKVK